MSARTELGEIAFMAVECGHLEVVRGLPCADGADTAPTAGERRRPCLQLLQTTTGGIVRELVEAGADVWRNSKMTG